MSEAMECYATPLRLLRDSRILWQIVELSFASPSLSPTLIGLSFLSLGGLMLDCKPDAGGQQ